MQPHEINSASDEVITHATDEYFRLADAGSAPELEAFVANYPQVADALRRIIPALDAVRNATGGLEFDGENLGSENLDTAVPLGDFLLHREIGRGGMGVVYEATQLSLSRRVAVKVLPFAAALDQNRIKRFRNESLAVAALDHPNIVEVYGVGCERGVHYYAMRYIEGCSLADIVSSQSNKQVTEVATQRLPQRDSTRSLEVVVTDKATQRSNSTVKLVGEQTLSSFSVRGSAGFRTAAGVIAQVARALEHAHRQGIVHRDIKPSNLMIDANGKPWVTDFGLAQVVSSDSLTLTGDVVGTLRYMSPEQVGNDPIDYRTDIYSLGATLYELLALRPMFAGTNRADLLHHICNAAPSPLAKLRLSIPRELETIVDKATSREPSNRYGTAAALADDLQAWLDGKPIAARPPTSLGKAWRWAKRNPLVATLLGAIIFLSVGTAAATSWFLLDAKRALQAEQVAKANESLALEKVKESLRESQKTLEREQQAHQQAEQNANNQRFTASVLTSAFKLAEPIEHGKKEITALDVLRAAVVQLENPQQVSQPDELTKAQLLDSIGQAMAGLSKHEEAVEVFEKSLAIKRNGPQDIRLAVGIGNLGYTYQLMGKYDRALELAEEAYEMAQSIDPKLPETMAALDNLGQAHARLGDYAQAAKYIRDALDRRVLGIGPNSADAQISRNNLAMMLTKTGDTDEAIELYKINLEIARSKFGEKDSSTIVGAVNYAVAIMEKGQVDEAITLLKRQFQIAEELLGREHPTTCSTVNNLGSALMRHGNPEEAMVLLERNLAVLMEQYGEEYPQTLDCLNRLGKTYTAARRFDLALPTLNRASTVVLATRGEMHPSYATALGNLALATFRSGDQEKAWPILEDWIKASKRIRGPNAVATRRALVSVGDCYRQAKLFQNANQYYSECLQLPLPAKLGEGEELTTAALGVLQIGTELTSLDHALQAQMLTLQERQNELESQSEMAEYLFKVRLLMGLSAICQSRFYEGEALLNSLSDLGIEPNSDAQAQLDFARKMIEAKTSGRASSVDDSSVEELARIAKLVLEQEKTPANQALGQWMSSVLVELYTKLGNIDSATYWSEKIQGLVAN